MKHQIENKINNVAIMHPSSYLNDNDVEEYHKKNGVGFNHNTYEYTSGSYEINKSLWNHAKGTTPSTHKVIHLTNNTNTALDNTKSASDDFSVYSGVKRNPQELVKDSGGILHHAAFMSASITPTVALKFSNNFKTEGIRHVLKIQVRKGQKVGGYLGENSNFEHEKEFLLKSNQLLKIHPEYQTYEDEHGVKTHIHHAIVLEPHEYEHLGEHKEVQSFHKMKNDFNAVRDAHNEDIDRQIVNGKLSPDIDLGFDKRHIDKLVDDHRFHNMLLNGYQLSESQLDKVFKANKSEPSTLASQKNLSDAHIKQLISINDEGTNKALVRNDKIKLPKSFIDKLSDNDRYNYVLSKSPHIDESHISKIIKNNPMDDEPFYNLTRRSDLTEKHIDDLLKLNDNTINSKLASNKNLTENHINHLLKNAHNSFGIRLGLSNNKNLTNEHISKLLNIHSSRSIIARNLMSNHKLNDEHKRILEDDIDDFTEDEKKHLIPSSYKPNLYESKFEYLVYKSLIK